MKAANEVVVQTSLTGALVRRLSAVPNMQSVSTENVRATNITHSCWKCDSRLYSGQTTCSASAGYHCILHRSPVTKFSYRCDTRNMHNFKPTDSLVALVATDRRSRGEDSSMPFWGANATPDTRNDGARKIEFMSAAVANSVNNNVHGCMGSIAAQLVCSDSVLQLPYQKLHHHHQLECSHPDFDNSLPVMNSSTVSNWITSSWPVHELPTSGSPSNSGFISRNRDSNCRTSRMQESRFANSCSIGLPAGF
jgi:hypothetical protein